MLTAFLLNVPWRSHCCVCVCVLDTLFFTYGAGRRLFARHTNVIINAKGRRDLPVIGDYYVNRYNKIYPIQQKYTEDFRVYWRYLHRCCCRKKALTACLRACCVLCCKCLVECLTLTNGCPKFPDRADDRTHPPMAYVLL